MTINCKIVIKNHWNRLQYLGIIIAQFTRHVSNFHKLGFCGFPFYAGFSAQLYRSYAVPRTVPLVWRKFFRKITFHNQ